MKFFCIQCVIIFDNRAPRRVEWTLSKS